MTNNEKMRHKMRLSIQAKGTKARMVEALGAVPPAPPQNKDPPLVVIRRPIKPGGGADRVMETGDIAEMLHRESILPARVMAQAFVRSLEVRQVFPACFVMNGMFYWSAEHEDTIRKFAAIYASTGFNFDHFKRHTSMKRARNKVTAYRQS